MATKRDQKRQSDTAVLDRVQKPPKYKVVLHNDDFTPMFFVSLVLSKFFRKNDIEAAGIMMAAHEKGKSIVGIYTKEIANTKCNQSIRYSRKYNYPLLLTKEPE
jgi:ATP-dependent Clp protease adaptor protein ClpS